MSLADYVRDFRGRPACPCQVEWIPAFEHELQRRGIIQGLIPIAQLIGGAPASGGAHGTFDAAGNIIDGGGTSDFWLLGAQGDVATMVAREMGADATWHRLRGWDPNDPSGGVEHVHAVQTACPHLTAVAASQIVSVRADGDGLAGTSTPDPGPRPLSGRTWREGIAWAQEEELMATAEETIRAIVREELANFAGTATVPNPGDPKGKPWTIQRLWIDTWKRAGK